MWSSTLLDDVDWHDFIKTPAEACQKTDWQVPAFWRLSLGKPKGAKSNLHRWMNRQPDNISQPKLDI